MTDQRLSQLGVPKITDLVPDGPRWPSVQRERGEGVLISLPSLHRDAIYVSFRVARRGPWHLGFGRQFTARKPRWALLDVVPMSLGQLGGSLRAALNLLIEATDEAEERAIHLEDEWGRLEHHLVAEAYGEVSGLQRAQQIVKGLIADA